MPSMRTIDQAAAWLCARDPETALTKTALRRLIITGQLPSVRVGQKYLISLEVLERFLGGELRTVEAPDPVYGSIRRIC